MSAHSIIRLAAHNALCEVRTNHSEHVWISPVPFFDDVADAIEALLLERGYTITKTDDGAVSPPADSTGVGAPEAAESATGAVNTVAAPSSQSSGAAS